MSHDSGKHPEWLQKTGIFPVNFEAIEKAKFSPSLVTDSKIICCDIVVTFLSGFQFQARDFVLVLLHI